MKGSRIAAFLRRGTLRRSRPKPADGDGCDVVDAEGGNAIFGYKVAGRVCVVTANIYDEKGSMIAESLGDDFIVRILPSRLGDVRFVRTMEEA
jgi:hypothetical protein